MRVFVSEYVSGGGCPGPMIAGSLAIEGRAMLCAIVEDLSRIAGVQVTTTWDARLGSPPFRSAQVVQINSPSDELSRFRRLAAECEATLVIAPEFNGILLNRCLIVEDSDGRLLGPSSRAVALCADKLRLATHLREAGIITIPTEPLCEGSPRNFPAVIKPRDGAGSQDTFLVQNTEEFERLGRELRGGVLIWADCGAGVSPAHGQARRLHHKLGHREQQEDPETRSFIWQPHVAGRAVSVALFVSPLRREVEILLPAEQRLTTDGRFRYLGGRVPIALTHGVRTAVQTAALAACRCVPSMCGYVGVDLILPDAAPHEPVIVEINPRLTTSYLGYRALAENNLAEWMLIPGRFERSISWRKGTVEFDAAGTIDGCNGTIDPARAQAEA